MKLIINRNLSHDKPSIYFWSRQQNRLFNGFLANFQKKTELLTQKTE